MLFVDTSEEKAASLLFMHFESGFNALIEHTVNDLPASVRSGTAVQREVYSLRTAIEQHREFIVNREFHLLLTSVPLFAHLLISGLGRDILGDFNFTLAYVGDDRSGLPGILTGNGIFNKSDRQ